MCGESTSSSNSDCEKSPNYTTSTQKLQCSKDTDEMGLFYKCLPDKTLVFWATCFSGSTSSSNKWKSVVIGK